MRKNVNVRVSEEEKNVVQDFAEKLRYDDESSFMRAVIRAMSDKTPREIINFLYGDERGETPILGYVYAGKNVVKPLEGCYVDPELLVGITVDANDYALIVNGNSMTTGAENSIEHGALGLFRPGLNPDGRVVHMEYDENGERFCRLKKYHDNGDGTVTFRSSNPDAEDFTKKQGEFAIRGVFLRKLPARLPRAA